MAFEEFLIAILAYLLPLYAANSCALLFGGGVPLDFNKKIGGKPVFGAGKTIKGTIAGLICGLIAALILSFFITEAFTENYLLFSSILVTGGVFGDIIASFFKRRLGFEKGQAMPLIDQLDFVIGGIILTLPIRIPSVEEIAVIFIATIIIHRASNYLAFKIKMKEVPW